MSKKIQVGDIVQAHEYIYRVDNIVGGLYNRDLDNEDIENRMSFYTSEVKLIQARDEVSHCPRCKGELTNNLEEISPTYVFACINCDQDFYFFEAIRGKSDAV